MEEEAVTKHSPEMLELLEQEKLAAPRWVKEVRKALQVGDIEKADRISKAMSGHKAREVLRLPAGSDARPSIMAGAIPGSTEKPGLFVTKFLSPHSGMPHFGSSMRERALTEKMLGDRFAKVYGRYMDPAGKGGVEFQEFLPGVASPQMRRQVAEETKGIGRSWLTRKLWDVADHEGNVRLSREGVPKILDARFDAGPGIGMMMGTVREREKNIRRAGAGVLRAAQAGTAQSVSAPSWASENLPEAGMRVGGAAVRAAPIVLPAAMLGLIGHAAYRDWKKQKSEQEKTPMNKTARVLSAFEQALEKTAFMVRVSKAKDGDDDLTPKQSRILGAFAGGAAGGKGGGVAGVLPGALAGAAAAQPTHHVVRKIKGDYAVLRGPIAGLVSGTAGHQAGKLSKSAYGAWRKKQ